MGRLKYILTKFNCNLWYSMLGLVEIVSIAILVIWSLSVALERRLTVLSGRARASIIIAAFGLVPIAVFFAFNISTLGIYAIIASIASGGFWALGALLYFKSLETEQVSNTAPTGLLQVLPLILFGVLALSETINLPEIVGAVIMVIGVLAASTSKG
ncbi:MAG: GRP family sugar transporter, partial [Candidatus Micrarchaeaceae archaeon]